MTSRVGAVCAAFFVALAGVGRAAPAAEPGFGGRQQASSPKPIARFKYIGGTEIAFSGRYAYAAQMDGHFDRGEIPGQGGVHIFDVSKPVPRRLGFLHCPGNDNDVAVVRPGLIALGYHSNKCGLGQGMLLADVSKPRKPRVISYVDVKGSSHTITPYPGKPIVYVSPGGLAYTGPPEQIVDVSDPYNPEVVATYEGNPNGCHDVSFHITEKQQLAICAGYSEVQIWDVSDPLAPATIGSIVNPSIQFPHYGEIGPDDKTLVVNDEAFAAHDCTSGQSPTGAIWTYDVSDPTAPQLLGHFSPPRGEPGVGNYATWVETWCTSHQFSFTSTGDLVVPWFTGGTSLIDLSDPANPRETAYYRPDNAIAYSSQYRNGLVYINDMNRGFEVLSFRGG